MLIDFAPEPAPRTFRLASPDAPEPPGAPFDSFGAVLARLAPGPADALVPAPEPGATPSEADPNARREDASDELAAPNCEPKSRAAAGEDGPTAVHNAPGEGHVLPDAPQLRDLPESPTAAGAQTGPGEQAFTRKAGPPAALGAAAAPLPRDGGVRNAATPPSPHSHGIADTGEHGGAEEIERQPTAFRAGPEGPAVRLPEARDPPASVPGGTGETRRPTTASDLPLPGPTRPAAVHAPPPPVLQSALELHLAEARTRATHLLEGSTLRLTEGAFGASAGLGDPIAPAASTETAGARLPYHASGAAAETARDVAQQIAARIVPLARGQFELMLAPAELGRLEISLREIDGLMTLSVNAERPETLELIRRHVDLLAQELRQIAQRDLSLQLGTGGTGGRTGGQGPDAGDVAPGAHEAAEAEAAIIRLAPGIPLDHLDLRL